MTAFFGNGDETFDHPTVATVLSLDLVVDIFFMLDVYLLCCHVVSVAYLEAHPHDKTTPSSKVGPAALDACFSASSVSLAGSVLVLPASRIRHRSAGQLPAGSVRSRWLSLVGW